MTSRELVELMVYDRLYPFGYERLDLHNASLSRQIAFGALSEPSRDLLDYLTIPLVEPQQEYNIELEQQRVSEVLDMIFF